MVPRVKRQEDYGKFKDSRGYKVRLFQKQPMHTPNQLGVVVVPTCQLSAREMVEAGNWKQIQAHGLMDMITYLDYRRGGRRGREEEEEISRTGAWLKLSFC